MAMAMKSKMVVVRMDPEEKKRLQAACKELGTGEAEFIRACIRRELAMNLDPVAIDALADTFRKGMKEVVGKLINEGIEAAKKREAEKKEK